MIGGKEARVATSNRPLRLLFSKVGIMGKLLQYITESRKQIRIGGKPKFVRLHKQGTALAWVHRRVVSYH